MIKKYFTALVMTALVAMAIPALSGTASAQRREYGQNDRYYDENSDGYNDSDNRRPNVYNRHRKAINIVAATGLGAVIGAIFGGKKGALIGAAAGVAGGAIITKKQRPRNYARYSY